MAGPRERGRQACAWASLALAALLALCALASTAAASTRAAVAGPPALGRPGPDCGAVNRDYTDSSCSTQTRLGVLSVRPDIAVAAGTVTGSWAPTCGRGADGKDPCPAVWDDFLGSFGGAKHSRCSAQDLTCTVQIPKDARTRPFGPVEAGITNDQGTGISRVFVAILGDGWAVVQGRVTRAGKPVRGTTVDISGPSGNGPARTDSSGFYYREVKAGSYHVGSSLPGACVVGVKPCAPAVRVDVHGAHTVDIELEAKEKPNLALRLEAPELGDDSVRLRLTVENRGKQALSALALSKPAVSGDTGVVASVAGPSPVAPTALRAGAKAVLAYRVVVAGPGKTRLTVTGSAKDASGKQVGDGSAVELEVAPGDAIVDKLLVALGTFDAAEGKVQAKLGGARSALLGAATKPIASIGAKADIAPGLAGLAGLGEHDLDWLPSNSDRAIQLWDSFMNGVAVGTSEGVTSLSTTVGEGFSTSFSFWNTWINGTVQQKAELATEAIGLAQDSGGAVVGTGTTWLKTSYDYWSDPKARAGTEAALRTVDTDALAAAASALVGARDRFATSVKTFAADYRKDPEGAATGLGRATGRFTVETGLPTALTFVGPAALAKLGKVAKLDALGILAGEGSAEASAFSRAASLEALAGEGSISLAQAERVGGLLVEDAKAIQTGLREIGAKNGVQLQFEVRPANPHAVGFLRDGSGVPKLEIFKEGSADSIDVLLGAKPSALGKMSVYEPTLPANLSALPAEQQAQVRTLYEKRLTQFKAYEAGTSDLARATRPGGLSRTATLPGGGAGNAYAAELEAVRDGNTITFRTKSLTVNGKPVGKAGSWIVSDLDGHALIDARTGKALSPEIRSKIELEFKQYFDKNVSASGRHGFTFNGFDWATKGNELDASLARAKFLLNAADEGAATRWVQLLKRAFPKDAAIQALTPGLLLEQLGGTGKYVIKITAQAIKVGTSVTP